MRSRQLWAFMLLSVFMVAAAPVATVLEPEAGRLGGGLPHPRGKNGTSPNLAPESRRASNWPRSRFYLLSLASTTSRAHTFAPLPTAQPDVEALRENRREATVTWVGHSTLLVQLDGVNILTDPVWSHRLGPLSGTVG